MFGAPGTGYVPSTVTRKAIGSLIVGYFDKGALVYAGRVGTGYTHKVAANLFERLESLGIDKSPFGKKLTAGELRKARFVRPEIVAEVEFQAWTGDGVVRHASFRGLQARRGGGAGIRGNRPRRAIGTADKTHPSRPALLER